MMPDQDGYPTDKELRTMRKWPWEQGFVSFMEYVKSCWWAADWGWSQRGHSYYISTGGWSGNESIIYAMHQNFLFWSQCWKLSRVGGHYRFFIPKVVRKSQLERAEK